MFGVQKSSNPFSSQLANYSVFVTATSRPIAAFWSSFPTCSVFPEAKQAPCRSLADAISFLCTIMDPPTKASTPKFPSGCTTHSDYTHTRPSIPGPSMFGPQILVCLTSVSAPICVEASHTPWVPARLEEMCFGTFSYA